MVQNDSWEWLLTGFKFDLETQVKPKTVKDYCDHVSYFARWAEDNDKGTPSSISKRDIQEFLHYVASTPAIFSTGNGTKRIVKRDDNSRWHHYFPLKRFFTWAIGEGYLNHNPIDTIVLKPPKAALIEPYGTEHIGAFIKILEHEWKCYCPPRRQNSQNVVELIHLSV
jgi:site-specific recombinase XerD